jgi:pseudouridine-5'-phosphate glycosidase
MVVADEVAAALAAGRPVVALESTIIAHGLPRPRNLEVAERLEAVIREGGAVPATIAVLDGVPAVGLDRAALQRVAGAGEDELAKLSVRDLPLAAAREASGATTVASTAYLAARAGIRVFATGGLGGVHRGASATFDESADLLALASTPIAVVSAGVKSILDVGATLERLETLGIAVVGYRTSRFPGFYVADGGFDLDWRVDGPEEVAAALAASDDLGLRSALLVANPIPVADELDRETHDASLAEGLRAAAAAGVRGKPVTPFLLEHMVAATGGASLEANIAAVLANAAVAAEIARAWSERAG